MLDATTGPVFRAPFAPHLHQWHAYQAATHRFDVTWLCGGVGGGKTYLLAQWMADMALEHAPGVDGLLVEPDFSTFYDVFMPTWRAVMPGEGVLWALKSDEGGRSKRLVVRPGHRLQTVIFVRSAVDARAVQRIDGLATVGWWGLDEPARMAVGKDAFQKCIGRGRVVTPLGRNPGLIVGSPRGLGHWLPRAFGLTEDHPEHGYSTGYLTPKRGYYVRACRTVDNAKHLAPGYAERMREAFGDDFYQQEANASLVRAEGQMFPPWRTSIHVLPNAVADDLWDRRVRRKAGGVDWGWTNPAVVLPCGVTEDEELVAVDCWYQTQRHAEEQGALAHHFGERYGCRRWMADPSEPGDIQKWQRGFNWRGRDFSLDCQPADNRWKAGIDTLRMLMELRRGPDHPAFPAGNGLGAPRLYVAERCTDLIAELGAYIQLPLKEGQQPREGAQGADHAIDALRYAAQELIHVPELEGQQLEI